MLKCSAIIFDLSEVETKVIIFCMVGISDSAENPDDLHVESLSVF